VISIRGSDPVPFAFAFAIVSIEGDTTVYVLVLAPFVISRDVFKVPGVTRAALPTEYPYPQLTQGI
jgi:hypothetical protein